MGSSIVDDALLTEAAVTFDAAFQNAFDEVTAEAASIDAFVMSTTSRSKKTKHVLPGMLPKLREWLGERIYHTLTRYAMELENRRFEDSVEVDIDDIADDQLGGYTPIFSELGRQSRLWPRDLVIEKLKTGTTEKGFDGQFFFDTDHPVDLNKASAGTYANLLTGAGSALGETGLIAAATAIGSTKGPDGRILGVRGNLLIVPQQLEVPARKLVVATQLANGATNVQAGAAQVLVLPELNDEPDAWYLAATSGRLKPMIFQLRQAPVITSLDKADSPNVFEKNLARYGVKARGAAGFGLPFLIVKNVGV